jgi:hypothetical protein
MRTKARHYYPPIKKCRGSTLRKNQETFRFESWSAFCFHRNRRPRVFFYCDFRVVRPPPTARAQLIRLGKLSSNITAVDHVQHCVARPLLLLGMVEDADVDCGRGWVEAET